MKPREMHLSAAETFIVCFVILLFERASAEYFFHRCLNTTTNYTAGSPYGTNRNQLLVSLTAKASTTGFYNDTAGQNPNTVYGRALCRGDLSPSNCSSCLTNARNQILQRCPFSRDAIIWFDECHIVHYSRLFVFNTNTVIRAGGYNAVNVSDPTAFNGVWESFMANLVTKAASDSSLFYAADSINSTNQPTIYGLVQCCRDLSRVECKDCLGNGLADISRYGYAQGVRFHYDSCTIRSGMHAFFGASAVSPSNSPTGGRKRSRRPNATIVSVGAVLVGALVGFAVCYLWRKKLRKANIKVKHEAFLQCLGPAIGTALAGKDEKSQDLPLIDLATVQASTDNFSDSNRLGKGGFGPVYKGTLPDGKEIAVKRLSRSSGQGLEEFKNEIISIAKLQHKNLVRLFGCCLEKEEKLLIYEYMPNKSLDFFLFDPNKRIDLDWRRRFDIIAGIARGLLYLHEDSRLKVIHRDLKASNVLLDHDMNPKISDFGMARIFGGNQDEASTNRVVGTYGYMAPEYAMEGSFSVKSDVFSFGVLLLEIVSGKRNTGFYLSEHAQSLLAYAWKLWSEERSIELMDHLLGDTCPISEVLRYIQIGLLCVQEDPAVRPPMSKVVLMLGTESLTLPEPMEPAFSIKRKIIDSGSYSVNEVTISKMDPR